RWSRIHTLGSKGVLSYFQLKDEGLGSKGTKLNSVFTTAEDHGQLSLLFGRALGRGSFIANGITNNEEIIQRSEVDVIGIDAFWKGCNRPISGEHACSFTWNMKDLRKLMKSKSNLIVSKDKGNGNCLVEI
nr:hypothetical protein [Tanacetum cinerariifolium]